jgi:hypothetical protein
MYVSHILTQVSIFSDSRSKKTKLQDHILQITKVKKDGVMAQVAVHLSRKHSS